MDMDQQKNARDNRAYRPQPGNKPVNQPFPPPVPNRNPAGATSAVPNPTAAQRPNATPHGGRPAGANPAPNRSANTGRVAPQPNAGPAPQQPRQAVPGVTGRYAGPVPPQAQRPLPHTLLEIEPEKKFNAWILVSVILIVVIIIGGFFAYRVISGQKQSYSKLETEASNLRMAQDKLNTEYQAAESERAFLSSEVDRLEQQVKDLEQKNATPSKLMVDTIEMKVPDDWLLVPGEGKGNYYLYGSKKPGDVSQGYIYTATYPLPEAVDLTDPTQVAANFDELVNNLTQDGSLTIYDYYESQVQNLPARIYSGNILNGEEEIPIKVMLVLEDDTVVTISATSSSAQDSQILLDSIVQHEKGDIISLY
ncbi:MAG: hypothetical protein Q4E09_06450 [Eubacteriales bacterium]|nr:hypothetical protein [Eubacteriales bacterium]